MTYVKTINTAAIHFFKKELNFEIIFTGSYKRLPMCSSEQFKVLLGNVDEIAVVQVIAKTTCGKPVFSE